jgi:hypothetical protein
MLVPLQRGMGGLTWLDMFELLEHGGDISGHG